MKQINRIFTQNVPRSQISQTDIDMLCHLTLTTPAALQTVCMDNFLKTASTKSTDKLLTLALVESHFAIFVRLSKLTS